MDGRGDGADHGDEMGLTELVEAAGVSVRTVRYYIAEGLLPPPLGAGPRAAYTGEHLDRLRLIARLKDAYLPLREIRRRLRDLDAGAVRALLRDATAGEPPIPEAPPRPADRPQPSAPRTTRRREDSASAYLSRLLPPRSSQSAPFNLDLSQPAPVGERTGPPEHESERPESAPAEPGDPPDSASLIRADLDRGAALAALDALADPDPTPAESWRRLRLGDDAELLIRADAYERQRDQIDALVAWARRIFA